MTERHCPKCAYRWNGAYNMDGKCTTCGTITMFRSNSHELKIARLPGCELPDPAAATPGAAALDIRSNESVDLWPGETVIVGTGFAYEPPQGHALFLLPRSGLGSKQGIVLGNLVGLIDPDYRGELKVAMWHRLSEGGCHVLAQGDRVAQLVCLPFLSPAMAVMVQPEDLSSTQRGEGGFGSSGQE